MESTRHLLDRQAFGSMKRSAYLINTARGPIINEADLTAALRDGEIAGAGLDVYEFEPKAVDGLSGLPNVVMTPHTASATISSRTGMAMKAASNLIAMVTGQRAADCVNPEVYQG
ncbi:MAG: D-glycerate dehydrogenase, partial [Spirochaetia bacterium]|nr:D-glycerate dehydrogenase [Spirochaetia bacterium]